MDDKPLSQYADHLISAFEQEEPQSRDRKISVNPVVSRVASLYEKVRSAMDYRDEEVILRAAIERILKRRILFGGDPHTMAGPLVRELVWARYFPDESLSESVVDTVEERIGIYLKLRSSVLQKHPSLTEKTVNEWMYHLMSSDLQNTIGPKKKKELMVNFMFNIMKKNILILDRDEQTKDIQVFIAVRKSYARDDLALLRYHLFTQIFGKLTPEKLDQVTDHFLKAYKEINSQLNFPRKEKIVNYVKDKTVVFFILEDILNLEKGRIKEIFKDEQEFKRAVFTICEARYSGIASKVRRAILRSVVFLLFTKAFFAIAIEGTYETLVFGHIIWSSTAINIGVPPLLMAIVGLFIRPPGQENSKRILTYSRMVLTDPDPRFRSGLQVKIAPDKKDPYLSSIFSGFWLLTFLLLFGFIIYLLNRLNFNILSMAIFVFFLAIVSFLCYRISQTAKQYTIEEKKNLLTPITDFIFLPFVRVGRNLTDGIAQINVFLFLFDFIIEAPFKGLFAFFEQWFLFLQSKREELE